MRHCKELCKKIKVKFALCLVTNHAMKKYEVVELHAYLTSVLEGNKWSALCSHCFTQRKRVPGTQRIARLAPGPDMVVKRIIPV
jgi:hypothetical protein